VTVDWKLEDGVNGDQTFKTVVIHACDKGIYHSAWLQQSEIYIRANIGFNCRKIPEDSTQEIFEVEFGVDIFNCFKAWQVISVSQYMYVCKDSSTTKDVDFSTSLLLSF